MRLCEPRQGRLYETVRCCQRGSHGPGLGDWDVNEVVVCRVHWCVPSPERLVDADSHKEGAHDYFRLAGQGG